MHLVGCGRKLGALGVILGINACRARSGGAFAHLNGIMKAVNPVDFGFTEVHIWSFARLLSTLPDVPWLVKHNPLSLEKSLLEQLVWERLYLPQELKRVPCEVLLNVDAGTICRFRPAVTMSRDMLSYEPGEVGRYEVGIERLRLIVLRHVQNASLQAADGSVFLTRYAAQVIDKVCGPLKHAVIIPHGVDEMFRRIAAARHFPNARERPIRCLYISNTLPYKHQWEVVQAVAKLRQRGFDLRLELVGGGKGQAQERLDMQIASSDPEHLFVTQREFAPQQTLPTLLAQADLFVFASSCENMPNTLLEAMAAGLPIACSDRGPMPEVLRDGGVYFDPEDPDTIAAAIETLITNADQRILVARRAKELSGQYSWLRCATEIFSFIAQTAERVKKERTL